MFADKTLYPLFLPFRSVRWNLNGFPATRPASVTIVACQNSGKKLTDIDASKARQRSTNARVVINGWGFFTKDRFECKETHVVIQRAGWLSILNEASVCNAVLKEPIVFGAAIKSAAHCGRHGYTVKQSGSNEHVQTYQISRTTGRTLPD